jgi:putative lipoprotein
MKNTTLVMGILAVLATLSGCGIGDAGGVGVGVGSEAGSYNAGRARREEIVTTRNAIGSGGGEDPASAFGASTSGAIVYSRCSYSQLDEETGVMGAVRPITSELDDGLPLVSSAAVTEYAGQQLGLIQHTGVLPADRTVTFGLLSSPAREQFITITMRDTEVLAADYGAGDPFDAQTERIALDLVDVSVKPDGVLVAMPSDIASAFGESTIALLSSDTVTSQCTQ